VEEILGTGGGIGIIITKLLSTELENSAVHFVGEVRLLSLEVVSLDWSRVWRIIFAVVDVRVRRRHQ